ncbi:DUF4190 domain-containing protein [Microbacterium hominis]|uniref:Uncharacterized protein n=1 Tax=Microbacterium hominis TaxID=162426 RepID=A0A134DHY7_9MICO|nr:MULTISPECIES: hypothetical protein [Microbacterium]AUG30229.1 hypothetical protein CXR34_12730 [Microbacterium hominis]KXC06146.1 hypothetical protein MhomT_06755 [Microbacterium hominis]QOC25946.1 DUF4190 domain-containing protein [Microbacterium hominis]QOC29923.1 DUF4190 domain-containing protein [Microbacterium hominis]QRY41532.1 DUF4190 domain-containing protein [Microbacterium hominis]
MTDPTQPPVNPPTPPSAPPVAPPAYQAAPAYAGPPAPGAPVPGRTLGIVAFVVAIFFNIIGLILGIVALVQSRKAGVKNGWAVAAIIVGAVLAVVGVIVGIILVAVFANAAGDLIQFCANNPSGVYEVNGQTVTCNGG